MTKDGRRQRKGRIFSDFCWKLDMRPIKWREGNIVISNKPERVFDAVNILYLAVIVRLMLVVKVALDVR